ncbi:MAG: trehalose-phosphatase [Elusimicrobia bacterium]|nr:MAG: trehalose-phosphatase [Elusimicrobiota bacterium]
MNHPPSALRSFSEIKRLISNAPVLLGLDFDGVLAPIIGNIPRAAAGRPVQQILRKLNRRKKIRIAIVTGRRLGEIKKKIPIPGLAYSGNHGLEIEAGNYRFLHAKARRAEKIIPALADELENALIPFPGAEIERKEISLSMHTRRCTARHAANAHRTALRIISNASQRLRTHSGTRVLEIQPNVRWNKGDAFTILHEKIGGTPIFLGDDLGDECAFKTANTRGGFGIRVSPRGDTIARYHIPSQRGVLRFLERIDALQR